MICLHVLKGECPYYHANCNHSEPHEINSQCKPLILDFKEVCPACINEEVEFLTQEEMVV